MQKMDVSQNGKVSKKEYASMYAPWKNDSSRLDAIVAFRSMDQNLDGEITHDEFVNTATEFFLNFTQEKPSKYFFGSLIDRIY